MAIDLDRLILLVAGAAMLAVAAAILAVRPGRGVNRALAALIAARGATVLLPQVSTDPAWAWAALNVQPYFALAVLPLGLYSLYAFSGMGGGARRRGAGWLTLGAVAALELAYFLDHGLLQSLAAGETTVGALRAAPGIRFTDFGPLALLLGATPVVLAYVGLRLAAQYRQAARQPDGPLLLLISAGLILGALFDGASRLAALTALLDQPGAFPWLPWGWSVAALPIAALVPALLSVAVLAAGLDRPRPEWRTERTIVALAGFAFFSGFVRLVTPPDSDVATQGLVAFLLGAWRLAMPVLVGYAMVRYRALLPANAPADSAPDASPPNHAAATASGSASLPTARDRAASGR